MTPFVLILARGGSKGVPRKNLQRIGQTTLLGRAIDTARSALQTYGADRRHIYVSTDDGLISRAAKQYGAHVIDRPYHLSQGDVPSEHSCQHAIHEWRERSQTLMLPMPSHLVLIQCTAPWLTAEDVCRCLDSVSQGFDSAFCAAPFHGKLWTGSGQPINHQHPRNPRQAEEPQYLEAGSCYVFSISKFIEERVEPSRFCGDCQVVEVPAHRTFEIDEWWQLYRAQALEDLATSQEYAHADECQIQTINQTETEATSSAETDRQTMGETPQVAVG